MSKQKKIFEKVDKAYNVKTSIVDEDGDDDNWSNYRILAKDVENAILKIKPKLNSSLNEYVSEVEVLAILDGMNKK